MEGKIFTEPLEDITWEKIQAFCGLKIEENIELDYKKDWPNELAALICAFANTQGGIILIGVDEIERVPICPASGVPGEPDALRQKAVNIAFDAIYPPVEPEVKSIESPDTPGNFVIFIRVYPTQLVHSVDRRRRIYVRSLDNKRGFDLATFSELKWLWDRRIPSESFEAQQLRQAKLHSESSGILFKNPISKEYWKEYPRLRVALTPIFPSKSNLISPIAQLAVVRKFRSEVNYKDFDCRIPWRDNIWRTIDGGVCISDRGIEDHKMQYVEVGSFGMQYFTFCLRPRKVNTLPNPIASEDHCIFAGLILTTIHAALAFSSEYYKLVAFGWPIKLSIKLSRIEGIRLYHAPNRVRTLDPEFPLSPPSPSKNVQLAEVEMRAIEVESRVSEIINEAAKYMLWAFGLGWPEAEIDRWVDSHARRG